ncbi:MerR family transcriptional regulator [Algicella marina]|uniref:MerR family transcriptional regulator n=1 Tax=Algicella marina TaxID=2683284 RepID=A0A6P1SYD0_9RHOB|nr:MerR family transcriptional regulator [Algicella marina]QHQ34216.1 MerR family transcriptional regulator [Algicella marina]
MKIGALAARTGLSAHTIRYYERIGLLPRAGRDGSGRRDYDETILTWIDFLRRLKATGMPIRQMLEYARLRGEGDASAAARLALMEAHRVKVRADAAELACNLSALDTKIAALQSLVEKEPT